MLFFLSQGLSKNLSAFCFQITQSKKVTIYFLAFLLLPGTIIHELSHYSMAKLLFVYAGHIHLLPSHEGNILKLGSVQVGKTDIIRSVLIGIAPFLFGLTIILSTIYAVIHFQLINNLWIILLTAYITFEIGNTMFSSKRDMEGAIPLFTGVFSLLAILWLIGVRTPNMKNLVDAPLITSLLQKSALFMSVPIITDCIVLTIIKVFRGISK
jgi:hypothetical protein